MENTVVLKNISLAISPGEIIVVRGRSGVGKTTLSLIAALLSKPDHGRVFFQGVDPWRIGWRKREKIRLHMIGYVDQYYTLAEGLTAKENIELPLRLAGLPRREIEARVERLLEALGLTGKADRYPGQLSGGEKQRIALARALAKNPALIVGDEPFSNLDDETMAQAARLIAEHVAEKQAAALITTTDLTRPIPSTREYILEDKQLKPLSGLVPTTKE